MLGSIYNCIGNLLGEEPPPPPPPPETFEDPEDFKPGFLFDVSASWILFVRRLLIPESARTREVNTGPACPVVCKCDPDRNKKSKRGGCGNTKPKKKYC